MPLSEVFILPNFTNICATLILNVHTTGLYNRINYLKVFIAVQTLESHVYKVLHCRQSDVIVLHVCFSLSDDVKIMISVSIATFSCTRSQLPSLKYPFSWYMTSNRTFYYTSSPIVPHCLTVPLLTAEVKDMLAVVTLCGVSAIELGARHILNSGCGF